jgi:hypothetical protein
MIAIYHLSSNYKDAILLNKIQNMFSIMSSENRIEGKTQRDKNSKDKIEEEKELESVEVESTGGGMGAGGGG